MTDLIRRTRLHELEGQIRACYAQAARELWQMGCALREVQEDELWRHAGPAGAETGTYATFDAWLDGAKATSRATAYKAMRIAREFGEEMAARFGTEKLTAGIAYLQATVRDEQPGDLLAVQVRTRQADGTLASVPFIEATAAQIRKATADLRHARRQSGLSKELRERLAKLNRQLPKARVSFGAAQIRLHQRRDGQVLVSLTAVPLDRLDEFVAAVRAGLVDERG